MMERKRVLISETQNYQAVVELTQLDKEKFTYKRMGKDTKRERCRGVC